MKLHFKAVESTIQASVCTSGNCCIIVYMSITLLSLHNLSNSVLLSIDMFSVPPMLVSVSVTVPIPGVRYRLLEFCGTDGLIALCLTGNLLEQSMMAGKLREGFGSISG